jgi:hypothetical protein
MMSACSFVIVHYSDGLLILHSTNSGAMREHDEEELSDIIPIEAFDKSPVEPYKPRYTPAQVHAMLTKGEYWN